MGDELEAATTEEDGLTEEERAILDADEAEEGAEASEADGEKETASDEKKEVTEGELEAEAETHKPEKDNLIPQAELDRRVKEIKIQAEQKLELFKRDPEEYYQQFPDERPADIAPRTTDTIDTAVQNLVVKGGPYDGMTLQEVMNQDQIEGNRLLFDHWESQREAQAAAERSKNQELEQSQREVDSFMLNRAKELYDGKEEGFTQPEIDTLNKEVETVLAWMKETKRGFANLEDGWYLMNRDEDLAKAGASTARTIATLATKGHVQTISSNASSDAASTGYEGDMEMTPEELGDKIDKMSEKAYADWKAKAPDELKAKYPAILW